MATLRKQETVTIPIDKTAEGGTVEVIKTIRARDVQSLTGRQDMGSILAVLIKSWNLTDDEGKPLPVNEKTVLDIDMFDANALIERSGLLENVKKNTPAMNG